MPDEVEWLTPEQLREWMAFAGVLQLVPQALDAQLRRDSGLNLFEYMVLAGLSDRPDRTRSMTELALFAGGSLSRLSHAIGRLERHGWVVRRSSRTGRRRNEVILTDDGYATLADAAPGHVREVRRLVVDVLGASDFRSLGDASRAMLAATSPGLVELLGRDAPGPS